MIEQGRERFLNKRIDFLAAVFFQVDRTSKFIMEMDHYKAKDIRKLKKLIDDLEADLKYHITTKMAMQANEGGKLMERAMEALKKINAELEGKSFFNDPDGYMDLLTDKKAELINLAGLCGLVPQYQDGMPIYER